MQKSKTPMPAPQKSNTDKGQRQVDQESEDSFPASDPPAWPGRGGSSHRKHKEPEKKDKK